MKKSFLFAVAGGALLLSACHSPSSDSLLPKIPANPSVPQETGLGDLFEFVRYVVLETPDSLPLGAVSSLQIRDGRLLVSDFLTRQAFVFDRQGSSLGVLSRHGRADNEYTELTDCEFTSDGGLSVYDGKTGRILEYAPDCRTCRSIRHVGPGIACKRLSDGLAAVNDANNWSDDRCAYRLYDAEKEVYAAVSFDEALRGHRWRREMGNSLFCEYGGRIYMTSQSDDIVYEVDRADGTVRPSAAVDFGRRWRPEVFTPSDVEKIWEGESPSFPYCFYDFGDCRFVLYAYDKYFRAAAATYDGDSLYDGLLGRDENGLSFLPVPYCDSDRTGMLVSVVPAGRLASALRFRKNEELDTAFIERLIGEAGDNTVLVFYRLKRPLPKKQVRS